MERNELNVGSKLFSNSSTNEYMCMYHDKRTNLIISGGHSILVDALTPSQEKAQRDIGFIDKKIEDKYMLLACNSEWFEKMEVNNEVMEIYHLCLESEDELAQFGIWVNDTLTETSSIQHFLSKFL